MSLKECNFSVMDQEACKCTAVALAELGKPECHALNPSAQQYCAAPEVAVGTA